MNFSFIIYILGWVLNFAGIFLTLPCIVSIIYKEEAGWAYLSVSVLCLILGFLATRRKPRNTVFYAREGFIVVALSWIVLSIFGALPFVISGDIPSFTNALFETISGFTTTGASILSDVEALSYSSLFWRSFTHWIGGMGVLVFILAILPLAGGYNMHLMRAESPGPSVSKLVPRVKSTAMILYSIYMAMTVLEMVLLKWGGMTLFDAITISFGTAGTGGFGIKNSSMGEYSTYLQAVVTIFMIIFGINFNVFYLLLIKKPKDALKCEEMRYYLGIIAVATVFITINIRGMFPTLFAAFHHAFFQVGSIITTTGYSTVDFDLWPSFSKTILILLMCVGACAGSTAGGIKVSRIVILCKTIRKEIEYYIHPRSVKKIKMDDRQIEHEVLRSVNVYLITYALVFSVSLLIISIDNYDFNTNVTAVLATFNNIGPGLGLVGPTQNFDLFSPLSKYVLMFDMLAGRLELFPMLLLFAPHIWKKY